MPYIDPNLRASLSPKAIDFPSNAGELNYQLTEVVKTYLTTKGLCYKTINDILGALEGAKQEFYRRVAVPYEDRKRQENGDVYGVFLQKAGKIDE